MCGKYLPRFLLLIFLGLFSCRDRALEKYTIFFTNDLQAHLEPDKRSRGGLARVAYLVKKEREKNPGRVLLLDAGDSSVGTAFGTETKGEAVFRVMNVVGYDAMVYGNHEFDLGAEQARRYQEIARFPILACNLREQGERPFAREYAVFQLGELKLGVIGLTNPKTPNLVDPMSISGLKFLPGEAEIRRVQNFLSGEADVLILLTHQGFREDLSLAYRISGIPLIIGGHSEVKLSRAVKANELKIAQAGHFGWWLGRIELFWDREQKELRGIKYKLIRINKRIPEDPLVKEAIEKERQNLPSELKRRIGRTWRSLSKGYLGFWSAELIKKQGSAEVGIINTGGIRSGIERGEITAEDLYEVMPFQDRIAVFEIDGDKLLRLKSLGWFYFSRGPKITPGRVYKVASLDYLLKINDFPGARKIQILEPLLREQMIRQIEKDQGFKRFWEK